MEDHVFFIHNINCPFYREGNCLPMTQYNGQLSDPIYQFCGPYQCPFVHWINAMEAEK